MTREIPLTQGKVALVDDEDYERVMKFKWSASSRFGNWYARTSIRIEPSPRQTTLWMHRFIIGAGAGDKTDHRDGNGLNNRRGNLRPCTRHQNLMNRGPFANNTSGFKGVSWHRSNKRWVAYIRVNGKLINLGGFATPEDAATAYDSAARKHFGEFARPNFSETA